MYSFLARAMLLISLRSCAACVEHHVLIPHSCAASSSSPVISSIRSLLTARQNTSSSGPVISNIMFLFCARVLLPPLLPSFRASCSYSLLVLLPFPSGQESSHSPSLSLFSSSFSPFYFLFILSSYTLQITLSHLYTSHRFLPSLSSSCSSRSPIPNYLQFSFTFSLTVLFYSTTSN